MSRRSGRRKETVNVGNYRRSMVQLKIGNRTYDAMHVAACKTCTHPARMLIEEKILQNYPFRAIAEQFSGVTVDGPNGQPMPLPHIAHTAIYNHFRNGHMPLEAATIRRLADERGKELGQAYEERTDQLIDHHMLQQAVVRRTYERMVSGEIEPDVKDGLAAAKLVAEVEAETQQGITNEAWSEAMEVYFSVVQQHTPPEIWRRIAADLQANPVLAAIARRLDPTVVDGEAVAIESRSA